MPGRYQKGSWGDAMQEWLQAGSGLGSRLCSLLGPVVFKETGLYILSLLIHRIASKKYLAVIISVSSQQK